MVLMRRTKRKQNFRGKLKKKKTVRKIKTKVMTEEIIKGGELIGQGTHGKIFVSKENRAQVIKIFKNRVFKPITSLCNRIKKYYNSTCDELDYEYNIQKIISDSLKQEKINIQVPIAYNYNKTNDDCYYIMDRIYPLQNKLLLVDMTDGHTNNNIIDVGIQTGYLEICIYLSITPKILARRIGELFSFLHFRMNLDGYDCELILGKKSESAGDSQLFLIDFDKVSCFDFTSKEQILHRKISEEYFEEKIIKTPQKMAVFLFGSFISMSLLPFEPELKYEFLQGYNKYSNNKNEFEVEVKNNIAKLVNEYMIT